MTHLIFVFYIVGLLAGAASLAQTAMIQLRYRKPVIRYYGLFLLSLYLILTSFTVLLYGRIAGLPRQGAVAHIAWIFQAAGGIGYIFIAPFFYHALLGLDLNRGRRNGFYLVDALVLVLVAADLALPSLKAIELALSAILFAMIGYGLLLIAASLPRVADKVLRKVLLTFFLLSAVFFPLMYTDTLIGVVPAFSSLRFLEGITQPLFFLILNSLSILFGLRYLNRPAYWADDRPTDHFLRSFAITPREAELIALLLQGGSVKAIAESLYISAKTVENHIYNIYQKVGVKNRLQLYSLVKGNVSE